MTEHRLGVSFEQFFISIGNRSLTLAHLFVAEMQGARKSQNKLTPVSPDRSG